MASASKSAPMTTAMLLLSSAVVLATAQSSASDTARGTITDGGNAVVHAASSNDLSVGPGISAVLAIIVGAAVCLFGFRLMRPTMFLCGFLVGGFLCASAADYVFKDKSYEATAWWVALCVGGIFLGSLVLAIYSTGIFIVGAAGGVLLATMVNTSFGYKLYPSDPNTGLLVLAIVLGLIGGLLAFKLEKPVIVVATSLVGAVLTISGIGYFAKNFPDITDLQASYATKDSTTGEWVYNLPTIWWAYVGGMVGLFVLGMLVQFKKTSLISGGGDTSSHKNKAGYNHA